MKTISINKKYMPRHIKTEIVKNLDENTYTVTHYYVNEKTNEMYRIVYPRVKMFAGGLSHIYDYTSDDVKYDILPFNDIRVLEDDEGNIFNFTIED